MWQRTLCFCLVLSVIITGSLSVPWNMTVSPVVFVPRGEDTLLGCSFTHPRERYSGLITVKWLARESNALPFFKCSVRNDSVERLSDCSAPGMKHSLQGDPRRGELSLLIRRVHLGDNGTYFCRVELDGIWNHVQKETQLYVTVKPQIVSLSVVEASSSSDGAPRRLQCEVEGHPLPTVTWLSASRSLSGDQAQTTLATPDRLVSSVPYLEVEVFTCRAESRLGGAERRYPASNTLMITLTVCGLVVLLLLCTGFIFYMRNRARADVSPVHGTADVAQVENHQLQSFDCPAEGDVEPQQVYSLISTASLTRSTSSQRAALKSSHQQQEEAGILYSAVHLSSQ